MPDTLYPEGVTSMDHIRHDMRMERFPERSSVETFLAERFPTGPALTVSITVMRNMLAGCQIIVGKGLTDEEIGDAEAAAVMELFKETYGRRQSPEGDGNKPDPERAIGEAMRAIELAGASPALTNIVVALEALQKDYRAYRDAEATQ